MKKLNKPEDWSSVYVLIENQIRQIDLISPSPDFTAKVFDKIVTAKQVNVYQPIISKKGWFMLAFFVGILVLYSFNLGSTENSPWFAAANNYFSSITLPDISFFHNKALVNSIAIGCVMLLFQFFIISKKYQVKE